MEVDPMATAPNDTRRPSVDDFGVAGSVALVTGASRGIGARVAGVYAAAGARLVLVARREPELAAVAAEVRAAGSEALVVARDLSDVSEAAAIVGATIAEYGRLDILVNNAGGAPPTSVLDTTPQALDDAFHFNVAAPFELTKRAMPHLVQSGRGAVINITSMMDRLAGRGLLIYGTVKAALAHMTRLLAAELAPAVRVNAIAPGIVETEELRRVLDETMRRRIVEVTPLRRLASTTDVANAALWLASPAAGYITGKVIELDGGAQVPGLSGDTPDLYPGDPRLTS
jgi:7-alpha-hydroxysteroid dehydrogenase